MAALYTSMVDCTIMVPIPKYSGENSMRCSNTQWIRRLKERKTEKLHAMHVKE